MLSGLQVSCLLIGDPVTRQVNAHRGPFCPLLDTRANNNILFNIASHNSGKTQVVPSRCAGGSAREESHWSDTQSMFLV